MFNEEGNHIDELFRSVLKDHQETPPASAWDNIVEKRSFGHILMNQISLNWKNFLFLTFVFATAGIAVIMATDGSKKQSEVQNIAEQTQQNKSTANNHHLQLAYADPSGGIIHGMRQVGNSSHYLINNSSESIIHSNNTNVRASVKNKKSGNVKHVAIVESNVNSNNKNPDENITVSKKRKVDKIANVETNSKKSTRNNNPSESIVINKRSFNSGLNLSSIKGFKTENEELVLMNEYIDLLNSKGISSLITLEGRFLLLDSNYFKPETRKKLTFKNHLFVAVKAGPEFHQTDYSLNDGEFSGYTDLRSSSTSSKVGGSIQVTLSYYLHNNIFFETGFRYNQLREEVKYNSFTVLSESTVYDSTLLGYKVGPTGEPVAIYDITERIEQEKDITSKSSINVYHTVGVPLLIGYQMDFNRFSVQLKTGASVTLFSKRNGEILGINENETINLGSNEDPYKNNLILNWEIAAGVGYQLTETISVIAEPTYRTSLNEVTLRDSPLGEKNKTFGFLTGIRIKL
jgi:hypothetical protein